jgi:hypothetical protein
MIVDVDFEDTLMLLSKSVHGCTAIYLVQSAAEMF